MNNGKDEIKKKLARKGQGAKRIVWHSDAIRTDESELYGKAGQGVNLKIIKSIDRSDFLLTYLQDIRMALGLNDAQIQVLLVLISSNEYKSSFKWSSDSVSHISKSSGLARRTVQDAFSNLVARKGLIIRTKPTIYELDKKMLIHRCQTVIPDSVNIIMTYRFGEPKTPLDKLIEKYPNVSLELVEAIQEQEGWIIKQSKLIQEIYNNGERERIRREAESKNQKEAEKKRQESLEKNKWE